MKKTVIFVWVAASFLVIANCAVAQGYTPLAPLPGTLVAGTNTTNLSTYLAGAIKLLVALGAALAVLFAIIGGTQYVAASINPSAKKDAMESIQRALLGLAIILTSYLLLNSINPKLVQFNFMLPPIGTLPGVQSATTEGGGVHTPLPLATNPLIQAGVSTTNSIWQPITSTSSLANANAQAQALINAHIDRSNDYSIISHCPGNTTYDLCPKTDLNHDGKTDATDLMLFMTQGNAFDVNQNKTLELADSTPTSATSCFFKKNTASIPDALARQGVLLDAGGHIIERATGEGISLGLFSPGGLLSLSHVGRTVSGSAVGYRDSSVSATSTAPIPTANITVTSTSLAGSTANISWSSTGATSCVASGGWSGTIGVSGTTSGSLSPTQSTSYYLTCYGAGGTVNTSATINLNNANIWIPASELGGACAVTNGLKDVPFGYVWTGNDQYSKFQALAKSSGTGNSINLDTFFSKLFWVVEGFGDSATRRFVETPLAEISYATIAQYDLNNDGTADFSAGGADVAAFNACKGSAVSGACAQADFNGDGTIDDRDLRFVKFMQGDVLGGSGFIPLKWKLNYFESMFFDPTGYTDKQIINYCLGRRAFEKCGFADMNGDKVVDSTDISAFNTGAALLDFNSDGMVNLQ